MTDNEVYVVYKRPIIRGETSEVRSGERKKSFVVRGKKRSRKSVRQSHKVVPGKNWVCIHIERGRKIKTESTRVE